MNTIRLFIVLVLISGVACNQQIIPDSIEMPAKGALITTRINSFEDLKEIIDIEYSRSGTPQVNVTHSVDGYEVQSILRSGLDESDFIRAQKGDIWDKISLAFKTPYSVIYRKDLLRAYILARWRCDVFGEGDIAFFDFAQTMVRHISKVDIAETQEGDLSEKGYLNTFNHITAQAFMTTIFSEKMSDLIADVHERDRIPELITGDFTEEQINDINNGAVDNYVDLINNEWGQELGKKLRKKHNITHSTIWTPELLATYLNDVQSYLSWVFQIGFEPFRPSDDIIQRFAFKINSVMEDVSVY